MKKTNSASTAQNKKWARRLLIAIVLLVIGLPVACCFVPPAGAQENHLDVRVTKMTACYKQEIIETGLPGRAVTEAEARAYYACLNNTNAQDERDYDLPGGKIVLAKNRGMGDPHDLEVPAESKFNFSFESQLTGNVIFPWFGSLASADPGLANSITVDNIDDRGGWEIFYQRNSHIGSHEDFATADFDDLVVLRAAKWETANGAECQVSGGVEFFHAPAQLKAQKAIFVAPILKVKCAPSDRWDVTSIGQWVGTHDTEYSGDRVFLVEEFVLHNRWSDRIKIDWTAAAVIGDTGRATVYAGPKVTFQITGDPNNPSTGGWSFWTKLTPIYTWDDDGDTFVDPKLAIGFKWVKPVK